MSRFVNVHSHIRTILNRSWSNCGTWIFTQFSRSLYSIASLCLITWLDKWLEAQRSTWLLEVGDEIVHCTTSCYLVRLSYVATLIHYFFTGEYILIDTVHESMCTGMYLCVRMCVCMYVCMYVCMNACVYVRMYNTCLCINPALPLWCPTGGQWTPHPYGKATRDRRPQGGPSPSEWVHPQTRTHTVHHLRVQCLLPMLYICTWKQRITCGSLSTLSLVQWGIPL